MSKRNPFKVAEGIMFWTFVSLGCSFFLGFIGYLTIQVFVSGQALTLLTALGVFAIVIFLIVMLNIAWEKAKKNWDKKHG